MLGAARRLVPGGLFVFTLQATGSADDEDSVTLGPDLRFAHSRRYVETVVARAELSLLALEDAPVRTEGGVPVPGWLAAVLRPS